MRLRAFFETVDQLQYEDALAVTEVEDFVDYIYSLTRMTDLQKLPRDTVRAVLTAHVQDGILRIPKDYGMFIAR